MDKIPFTSYDFWAYLSGGFFLLGAIDFVAGTGLLMRDSWTLVQGVIAVSIAYAVGQLIASASSLIFEQGLVGKVLGYPRDLLFAQQSARSCWRAILPVYFKSLPEETRRAALDKAKASGIEGPGEALFWAAYQNARTAPVVMERLTTFLNLYGFCRNTALVAFIDAIVLLGWYVVSWASPEIPDTFDRCDDAIGGVRWEEESMGWSSSVKR